MIGAIVGDIAGSRFEAAPIKIKDFEMFDERCRYTDDSVLACAVADALTSVQNLADEDEVKKAVVEKLCDYGTRHYAAGYGGMFVQWLSSNEHAPYGSYGNGSAMRVPAAGWTARGLEEAITLAKWTAEVTHNHPEGIKGAQAVAAVIYLARTGANKEDIAAYVRSAFYSFDDTCSEFGPGYTFDATCQGTVPQAIRAFLEGDDFEDVVRTAVSLGGDSDTLTCIAASMAEAYFAVPSDIEKKAQSFLTEDLKDALFRFCSSPRYCKKEHNRTSENASYFRCGADIPGKISRRNASKCGFLKRLFARKRRK